MRSLFDAERSSLVDALAMTEASLCAYGESHRHWRVAFSGGKDSSAMLTAIAYLLASGRVPRPQTLGVLYADTRLELPNLQQAALGMLDAARSRGWQTEIVYPRLDKRFFVMMLGRGIPPSHSGFRWCTGAIKVEPMALAMERERAVLREKLLLITGLRIGESANRDKRISLACGKNGGECGHGWFEQSTPGEVADVLHPLLHWRTCHVWDWLVLHGREHGFDCRPVATVYDQDSEHSENEVLARTGCLVCPVASRDLALERTLKKPEWAYLAPLLELRPLYEELSQPGHRLRKAGERLADGRLSRNPMRLGPLLLDSRRMALERILEVQDRVNAAARQQERPEVSLINAEELARIEELIAAQTWPDGWDGDEPCGDDFVPIVQRDGSVQKWLYASLENPD